MNFEITKDFFGSPILVTYLIVTIVIIFLALFLSRFYRNKEKVDKGFSLVYYSLSYRRRFIRSMWTYPIVFIPLIVVIIFYKIELTIALGVIGLLIISASIEIMYNYTRWKRQEKTESI
ncbi:hypothetical protein [Sutcliffiella rhizosphaerae]|uniref:Uncharacterized protein n=1 Tax=Sutcliffiella rhizosphaerae TaxID=2880967 RepID=A0ABM8YPI0_9BACI|nr:hypothetical protein [Sutcliffiella rhizosphaerae]CAG9621898.1 hypothetical protein BACCIP111883_02689 [Sutcliffiella rhizosphaerae]